MEARRRKLYSSLLDGGNEMNKVEFLKNVEKLLVLPNTKMFEELPDLYFEIVSDLEVETFNNMLKDILKNEDYFPSIKRWNYYADKYRRLMYDSYYYVCDNCLRYFSFRLTKKQYDELIKRSEIRCSRCKNILKQINGGGNEA